MGQELRRRPGSSGEAISQVSTADLDGPNPLVDGKKRIVAPPGRSVFDVSWPIALASDQHGKGDPEPSRYDENGRLIQSEAKPIPWHQADDEQVLRRLRLFT